MKQRLRSVRKGTFASLLIALLFSLNLIPAGLLKAETTEPEAKASISFEIINNVLPISSKVKWTGDLTDRLPSKQSELSEGATVKSMLEKYASEQDFSAVFVDGAWGPYLESINGLDGAAAASVYADTLGGGWTYKVNGTAPMSGMDSYTPKADDLITLEYTVTLNPVSFKVINNYIGVIDGAPWTGELESLPYCDSIYPSLPGDENMNAKDMLTRYADLNEFAISFDGDELRAFNGLDAAAESTGTYEYSWVLSVNGEQVSGNLSDKKIEGGDRLVLELTERSVTPVTDIPPETQVSESVPPATLPPETQVSESIPPATLPPETQVSESVPPATLPPETQVSESTPTATLPPETQVSESTEAADVPAETSTSASTEAETETAETSPHETSETTASATETSASETSAADETHAAETTAPDETEVQTVDFQILNNVLPASSEVKWTGDLTDSLPSKQCKLSEGETVKSLLEKYASEQGFKTVFADGSWGPYLESINGLDSAAASGVYANSLGGGWTYRVNGTSPMVGMDAYTPEPDDLITLEYVVTLSPVSFKVSNDVLSEEDGAPWTGELESLPYCDSIYPSLPADENMNAKSMLTRYAAQNEFPILFDGDELRAFNGLDAAAAGTDTAAYRWVLSINGQEVTEKLSAKTVAGGDLLTLSLQKDEQTAETSKTDPAVPSDLVNRSAFWPFFRKDGDNCGIGFASEITPSSRCKAVTAWTRQFGDPAAFRGFSSQPIEVNNMVYLIHGNMLEVLNIDTGASLKSCKLPEDQGYASTSPLYADGRVFAALNNGTVTALNGDTLEELWTYKDENRGQALTPMAYDYENRIVYAAFWNNGGKASLAALNSRDGSILWRESISDGFYWAGPIVSGNFLITGAEDGQIRVFDKNDGTLKDSFKMDGKIRSSLVSDIENFLYTASNTGHIVRFKVSAEGKIVNLSQLRLGSAVTANVLPFYTRLYIPSLNAVYVIDISSWKLVRTVSLPGYSQSSPLLLWDAHDINMDVFVTVNQEPGSLYVFSDGPADTGKTIAEPVFVPGEGEKGYCLASPIQLSNGLILYRNDSGTLFALRSDPNCKPEESSSAAAETETQKTSEKAPSETGIETAGEKTAKTTAAKAIEKESAETGETAAVPETGEKFDKVATAIVIIGIAAVLIIVVIVLRRKEQKEQNGGESEGSSDSGSDKGNGKP